MVDSLGELPKGHPERNKVADKIKILRSVDRRAYEIGRDGIEYVRELQGVEKLFQYVRDLNSSNRILDIGAGRTRGIRDLSKSQYGEGLTFEATVLTMPEINEWTLRRDQIHKTSVELLNGIEDESIGGALGVYSVAYSESPQFAARGINRILVPGGVFKGAFNNQNGIHDAGLKRFHEFQQEFTALGYGTAFAEGSNGDVLLAIKSGGTKEIDAAALLQADRESAGTQGAKMMQARRNEEEEQGKKLLKELGIVD
jgi:hypothetical protein